MAGVGERGRDDDVFAHGAGVSWATAGQRVGYDGGGFSRRRGGDRGRLVPVARIGILVGRVVIAEVELTTQAAGERVDLAPGCGRGEDRLETLLEDLAQVRARGYRGGVERLEAGLLEARDGLLEGAVVEDVELPEALDALPAAAEASVPKRPAGLHVLGQTSQGLG